MMKRQRGVTLGGLILASFLLIMGALLGFKLFTPYTQYFTVQKMFKSIAADPEVKNGSRREVINSWTRHAMIENVNVIGADDIEVTRDGNEVVLSASYSVKVPLLGHVSLLIDFNPTSAAR
jgi:hypothetical protein